MTTNRRKLSNFMLTPNFQLKLTFYYILTGVAIIAGTLAIVYNKIMDVRSMMNNVLLTDFSTQSQINSELYDIAIITMFGFVLFAMASFIFALVVSHRIAGPVLAILDYIEELKKGNYNFGRGLRPNDELTPIMDSLHELAPILRDKAVKAAGKQEK